MSRLTHMMITSGLIGSGVVAWALGARPLVMDRNLNAPLNPLGINGSPYGEVFAMAMQGPIDRNFNAAWIGRDGHTDDSHSHETSTTSSTHPAAGKLSLQNVLETIEAAHTANTNPKPASPKLRLFLRRQAEDKLRFAYHLDPSHYANYTSLHFFLAQPSLGTRPSLSPSVVKLADDTVEYCLRKNDPPAILTACAAVSNLLELMYEDAYRTDRKYTLADMKSQLIRMDKCIALYQDADRRWQETGNWKLLSPMRANECEDRYLFTLKLREAADSGIKRIEGTPTPPQTHH